MNYKEPAYPKYYTLCLNIEKKSCVVFGGGEVARRKAASLIDSGAKVTVVSPTLDPVLDYMSFQKEITWLDRKFEPSDLQGAYLVIAATDDRKVNKQIGELCAQKKIHCNVVDAPEEGDFIVPTTIERGPLTIAINTSGISPTLSASIRQEIEMAYGEEYGLFLELMALLRPVVQEEFPSAQERRNIFDKMVSSRAISLLRNGMTEEAKKELENIMREGKYNSDSSQGSLPIIDSKK